MCHLYLMKQTAIHTKSHSVKAPEFPLFLRIIIAVFLGVLLGDLLSVRWVRVFVTFNALFGQLLEFLIPLIIFGLVTPAIAETGRAAGKILTITLLLVFADTAIAGLLTYGTGELFFHDMLANTGRVVLGQQAALEPYFRIQLPPLCNTLSALVVSFMVGVGIAYKGSPVLKGACHEFKDITMGVFNKLFMPLLPIFIFGIFLQMMRSGEAYRMVVVFAEIVLVMVALHVVILCYEFVVAGLVTGRNPLKLFYTMLPAYLTGFGTESSVATIPVTLRHTILNHVREEVAGFIVPLCATLHMTGSMMKVTACALTTCILYGLPHDPAVFMQFLFMLMVCIVAAPGVPNGAVMTALAPLSSLLGFTPDQQALMIALCIIMDGVSTACNVTGDAAIALIVDKALQKVKA